MKFVLSLSLAATLTASPLLAEPALLSYWNFNNCDTPQEGLALVGWKTEPALFGEAFDAIKSQLSSNTNSNAIFSGPEIYLDFSQLHGKYEGTVVSGWGVFQDSKTNQLPEDKTTGGSFMAGAATKETFATFVLRTEGYKDLTFSAAIRALESATIKFSWSADGTHFQEFASETQHLPFQKITYNLSGPGGLGLTALDNQKTIYIRATFLFPSKPAGTAAIDNVQLIGAPL